MLQDLLLPSCKIMFHYKMHEVKNKIWEEQHPHYMGQASLSTFRVILLLCWPLCSACNLRYQVGSEAASDFVLLWGQDAAPLCDQVII